MKKTEQEKWENKLSSRSKWNRWKGVLVTTFSIIFGTFTNLLFTIHPDLPQYIGWILLAAIIIVCAGAILIDTIWDNKDRRLKIEYDLKYSWHLNPQLTNCVQENLSKCLDSYQFCKDHSNLKEAISVYYTNIRNTLNACCEVFATIFSEANEDKLTFSIRYMFKSKIDNKITLLWGKNSAPENIKNRTYDSDCYENTGAGDVIKTQQKESVPIPCTNKLPENDPYYEPESSSKLLVPVESKTSSKIIGVIVIKKKLTSDDGAIFDSANRKSFAWQYALKNFTNIIAMIERQFSLDVLQANSEQLMDAYEFFTKENDLSKEYIII